LMHPRSTTAYVAALGLLLPLAPASAQSLLERSPNIGSGWVGMPGELYIDFADRLGDPGGAGDAPTTAPTYTVAFNTAGYLFGAVAEPQAWLEHERAFALFARGRLLEQARGRWLDFVYGWSYDIERSELLADLVAARRVGHLRLSLAARGTIFDADDSRAALAAGAVLPLAPGRLPLHLAADLTLPLGRIAEDDAVWSAGIQVGLPETSATASLFASNALGQAGLDIARAASRIRAGLGLTLPVPLGGLLGLYAPREVASETVREAGGAPAPVVLAIEDFAYLPAVIEIQRGATVEWVNRDDVVHTASADDASWDSGAIQPGQRWQATFDAPGRFPYHCGPHPYMRGMVVVR
ncbi:MAG: cupredoxin domain-containing protein, partial [Longimicrobiales bacterium]